VRPLFFIALLFAAAGVCAQERTNEPPDLVRARNAYEAQVRAATGPIRERYLRQLEDIKTQLNARGNTAAALAVLDEINKMRAESGVAPAFDWQKLRHAASYTYLAPETFAQSTGHFDEKRTKLLDGLVGETWSENSVGWQRTKPSPILFSFTRPLQPAAVRLFFFHSSVFYGVDMPKAVRVFNSTKTTKGELIGEATKIPDRTGWLEIPLRLRTPVENIRVEIEPPSTGWTILEEVEFK
jgi:hypothetical protein